ncbi:hypothetical protein EON65_53605, partial [archaeon]
MKSYMWIVIALCMVVATRSKAPGKEVNWTYFEVIRPSSPEYSRAFIEKFPLHTYWDAVKGEYTVGSLGLTLGQQITDSSEFVTTLKKHVHHAGHVYPIDHHVINYPYVFIHLLVVIQHLASMLDSLGSGLETYKQARKVDIDTYLPMQDT